MAPDRPTKQNAPTRVQRAADAPVDDQLMRRRAIAVGAIVIVVILALLLIKGCLSAREERALKDYVNEAGGIVAESDQSGKEFFDKLLNPGDAGATELETAVNEQRTVAADLVRRAEKLDTPGAMSEAQKFLIETLVLRRDGLSEISGLISQALGDEQPEEATEKIAANMQYFLASDVVYSQQSYPQMVAALKANDLPSDNVPTSRFLPSLEWLDPATVDDVLSRARGSSGDEPVAPGLHGTGITGVRALPGETTLTADSENTLTDVNSIAVDVQNQGENDEKNIIVTLSLEGIGRQQDTIKSLAAGESATVTIPITRKPAKGQATTMKVEVRRVPGEENTDNNKQSFTVVFSD
jgi:hypothetical protein